MKEIIIGGIYEHYKGKRYRVLHIARHSETLEEMVVYQGLYTSDEFGDQPIWVRPRGMFQEMVMVEGEERPRFALVDTSSSMK